MRHEQQMIQDVLNGKSDSFRWIIERYQRPVFQMIVNLIHDRHAAEDLTQDVFVTVYRKRTIFDPMRSRFSTWLFTIARNKSLNYLRNNKKMLSIDSREVTVHKEISERIDSAEFFRQMECALNQLPSRQKRAFMLAEFENLPYEEIAQIECISIGTVKSRIHRAKQKLRKAFQQDAGD